MSTKSDVVTAIYQAFGEGDVGTILTHLTDDVDWASEASGTTAPWWGPYKGKEEVPGFFRALAEAVEVTDFTPLATAEGDNDVMVVIRFGMNGFGLGRDSRRGFLNGLCAHRCRLLGLGDGCNRCRRDRRDGDQRGGVVRRRVARRWRFLSAARKQGGVVIVRTFAGWFVLNRRGRPGRGAAG